MSVISSVLLSSCGPSKKSQRYYYSFDKKLLHAQPSDTKEIFRPLPYPASKDIQIEISDYNPLREEIIVEDSSSVWFLGDASKLAALVVFPKVADLTIPKNLIIPKTSVVPMALKNDCSKLLDFMSDFNDTKAVIENSIQLYKDFLSKIELIKDDYEFLKNQPVLISVEIDNRIRINFLTRLNSYLLPSDKVANTPTAVSSRELAMLEEKYFKSVTNAEANLDKIKKNADKLKGECPVCTGCTIYIDLYKSFNSAVVEIKDILKDLKSTHTEKILLAFNKTMLIYDQLVKYINSIPPYVTKAVPITKDLHTISIFKKEIGKDTKIIHDYINIEPDRGFKIDVAGGFFFSGLQDDNFTKKSKDSIYTKKYLLNGIPRDTTVLQSFSSLYKKNQFPVSFGGMIYLHAHSQNASWVNYGVYLGFGAMFNDQTRWAGALGGSLILGKSQRFCINPGIIIAQVDRLSPPYKTETWYPESFDNIPTYKAWKANFVLGFSWNLTK